jgi:hypothetical protein
MALALKPPDNRFAEAKIRPAILAEHNRTKREHAAVRRDRYYTSTTHREDPMAM